MNKGILIALATLPLLADAAPKKKPGGKRPAPVEDKEDKGKEAEAPADTPAAPAPKGKDAPTMPAKGKEAPNAPAQPATLPGAAGTTPATPATPQATPTKPGAPTPTGSPARPGTPTAAPQGTQAAPATPEDDGVDAKAADIDTLRREYLGLRDELFKSRARAHAVAGQLYSTRMTIKFTWGSARYYGVAKAQIRLDGATVYEDTTGAIAVDDGIRFDGYVAPGRHLVTFHVQATGKDDDSFTSMTETQITVKAIANKDLVVAAKGRDSGDIAYAWKRSENGSYGLGIDVAVKSVAHPAARSGK